MSDNGVSDSNGFSIRKVIAWGTVTWAIAIVLDLVPSVFFNGEVPTSGVARLNNIMPWLDRIHMNTELFYPGYGNRFVLGNVVLFVTFACITVWQVVVVSQAPHAALLVFSNNTDRSFVILVCVLLVCLFTQFVFPGFFVGQGGGRITLLFHRGLIWAAISAAVVGLVGNSRQCNMRSTLGGGA